MQVRSIPVPDVVGHRRNEGNLERTERPVVHGAPSNQSIVAVEVSLDKPNPNHMRFSADGAARKVAALKNCNRYEGRFTVSNLP